MNILTVSLDADLAEQRPAHRTNNVLERHLRYAEHLDSLRIIVKTIGHHTPAVIRPRSNLWIYPTRSRTRWHFLRDAHRIGGDLCRTQPVDCLSTQGPFATGLVGVWLKRRFGMPLNVHVMGDFLDNPHFTRERLLHRCLPGLARWVLGQADTIRVTNGANRQAAARRWPGEHRVWTIPLPIETAPLATATGARVRAALLQPPSRYLLVTASRLSPEKDLPMLLRTMRLVAQQRQDVFLVIVGDGPERSRLDALRRRWGLEACVRLVGAVAPQDVGEYLAACDVCVLTSRYEGMPRVLLEAAVCGKPLVATRTAGACELIRDGESGCLVDIGDAAGCMRRILELLDDPTRRARLGQAAARAAAPYADTEALVAQYIKMWSATVNGHASL